MAQSILRLPKVKSRTGLSRSTIYLWMALGRFPQTVPLGEHSVGWLEAEVDAWIQGREKLRGDAAIITNLMPKVLGAHT